MHEAVQFPGTQKAPPAAAPPPATSDRSEELTPGQLVGGFRIEHKLGAGGTSIVYAATHRTIGKRVAVKVLRRFLVDVPLAVDQFLREGRVANAIEHRNVAGVFDLGYLPDGRAYMLMERLPGETLRARLDGPRMPLAEVVRIGQEVCAGLAAIHGAGYVHGDIKPDNIFLTEDADGWEVVKLIDFGTSRPSSAAAERSRDGGTLIVGTPAYMPPEQQSGGAARPAGDIFALGVVLYEALVGRRPFRGRRRPPAAVPVASIARPTDEVPELPQPLSELVIRMLAPEPTARPELGEVNATLASAGEQAGDDRRPATAGPSLPLVARVLPPGDLTGGDARRRLWHHPWFRPAVAGASALIAVVAIALAIAWPRTASSAEPPRPAATPTATAVPTATSIRPPVAEEAAAQASEPPAPPPTAEPSAPSPRAEPSVATPSPTPSRRTRPERETGDGVIDPFQ